MPTEGVSPECGNPVPPAVTLVQRKTIFLPGSSLTRPRGGWNVPTAFDPSAYCTLLRAACAGAKPDASLSAAWYSAIAAERSPIL